MRINFLPFVLILFIFLSIVCINYQNTNGNLDLDKGGKSVDQKAYRSMIGSLLCSCASRSDIMLSSIQPQGMSSCGREANS
jgi:hypothetical protein